MPSTRAELYQLFVDYYYELQERKNPEAEIDRLERDELNLALGEVAKVALDSIDSSFRLRKSLIESISVMGKSDSKDSLFYRAIQLGWLNYIGITAEKPHEAAYAFFHFTFQEYFAALAIDDWDYFLPRDHINQPIKASLGKDKCYRAFQPNWREVILLWMGKTIWRSQNNQGRSVKESFIERLIKFEDGCGSLYFYQALFLASIISSEYQNECERKIIEQTLKIAFGELTILGEQLEISLSKNAKETLRNSSLSRITEIINGIFKTTKDKRIYLKLADTLLELKPEARHAVMRILKPCIDSEDSHVKGSAILIIDKLNRLNGDDRTEQFSKDNIIVFQMKESTVLDSINVIEQSIKDFFQDFELTANQNKSQQAFTQDLADVVNFYNEKGIYPYLVIQALKRVFYGSKNAVCSLTELLCCGKLQFLEIASFGLIEISTEVLFPFLVSRIGLCVKDFKENDPIFSIRKRFAYNVLYYCAQNMSYPAFYRAWNNPFLDMNCLRNPNQIG